MAELNQLDVSTRRYIRDNPALVDNWSQNDPLIAYAKLNTKEIFGGGSLIQEGYVGRGGFRKAACLSFGPPAQHPTDRFRSASSFDRRPGKIAAWNVCLGSVDTSCGPQTRRP